ncbi:MAG: iron ABC transporter permease [Bacteroidales bacterium]|nr:iron ABC transporter permease [Bacteroidales bacterium]
MNSKIKFLLLSLTLVLLFLIDFSLGTSSVSLSKVMQYLSFQLSNVDSQYVVLDLLRLPRVLAAMAAGICLSLSGLLMQTFFKNPLAGPYVLGISSGATLGVALFILAYPLLQMFLNENLISIGISGFAVLSSLSFMLIIFLISLRIQQSLTVLIAGLLLGTFANAITTLLQYSAGSIELKSFVLWNMGNINNTPSYISSIILAVGIISLIILWGNATKFDIWLIGEEQAASLGVRKTTFMLLTFGLTSILIGFSTAFYGPIAFIGLISPHIARIIFSTNLHKTIFVATSLIGVQMVLISDIILQIFAQFFEGVFVPLNTITSLLSLPLLLFLFFKKRELWM